MPIYMFLAVCLIIAGSNWLFFKSPFFRIDKVEVVGNSAASDSDVLDILKPIVLDHGFWESVLGFDNFLAWPAIISVSDSVFLPAIKSLGIVKNYRDHSLVVNVNERTGFGVWCLHQAHRDADYTQTGAESQRESASNPRESAPDECWWFDESGFIFKRAISSEGSLINTVHDYSQNKLGLNSKILPDQFITNAISIFRVLSDSGLSIKEIALKDLSLREMEVNIYYGPKIYFSLAFPADSSLEIIKDFQSKPGFSAKGGSASGGKNLEYLDFRVENKLYYK